MTCLQALTSATSSLRQPKRYRWHAQSPRCLAAALALIGVLVLPLHGQTWEDFRTPLPIGSGDTLVIGFLGGRERWDNEERSPRKLALKLRSRQMPGLHAETLANRTHIRQVPGLQVETLANGTDSQQIPGLQAETSANRDQAQRIPGLHVETLANRKRALAVTLVENAFDRDQDGVLDPGERGSARIVIYGLSFGGAATVKLARDLNERNIPVLLTIQIDSVGRDDAVIPPNVRRAANFYQTNGFVISGEGPIRAEDPTRTTIIADCRMDYSKRKIDISHVDWFKKLGRVAHSYISYDPQVWTRVETLVLREVARDSGNRPKPPEPCPPS